MHAISSYRGNRPTNTHTHRQDRLQYTTPLSLARRYKVQYRSGNSAVVLYRTTTEQPIRRATQRDRTGTGCALGLWRGRGGPPHTRWTIFQPDGCVVGGHTDPPYILHPFQSNGRQKQGRRTYTKPATVIESTINVLVTAHSYTGATRRRHR